MRLAARDDSWLATAAARRDQFARTSRLAAAATRNCRTSQGPRRFTAAAAGWQRRLGVGSSYVSAAPCSNQFRGISRYRPLRLFDAVVGAHCHGFLQDLTWR